MSSPHQLPQLHSTRYTENPSADSKPEFTDESTAERSPVHDTPPTTFPKPRFLTRKKILLFSGVLLSLFIIVLVIVIVLLTQHHKPTSSSPGKAHTTAVVGTSGSLVTPDESDDFTYVNNFGGDWRFNPKDPFAVGGVAQKWGKRIGEPWVWGQDIVRGVNLAGWLVTQPFITPALYEKYIDNKTISVVDEWSLNIAMGSNAAAEMDQHYKTFITEKDFADIAAAGLNFVRIPIGFWAIEVFDGEPYVPGLSWKYFLKAQFRFSSYADVFDPGRIEWGRKYGIRIFLEFNALPGSQNGWDHSGRNSSINMMAGVMGIANAERSLNYLRIFTQFIAQPQYKDVVPVLGVANDINMDVIGRSALQSFYYAAYGVVRGVTGLGAGNGPYVAIQDGFQGVRLWEGFLSGADRLAIDQHPLFAYLKDNTTTPDVFARRACDWASDTNRSSQNFGVTLGGQFSVALNDCGYWVNGVNSSTSFPDCGKWNDETTWDDELIGTLKQVTMNTMDALQNWFFFTWKIGPSTVLNQTSAPLWNYQLGLRKGWIPADPREAVGRCAPILAGNATVFDGNYPAAATGAGSGAGVIDPKALGTVVFPPASLAPNFTGTVIGYLPTYTPTGVVKTLAAPTFTQAPNVDVGNGWYNKSDTGGSWVPIPRCKYPDAWNAVSLPAPTAPCNGH